MDKITIRGQFNDDGTFVGFDYQEQCWYATAPDTYRNSSKREGMAGNPFAVLPPGATIIIDL